MLNEANHRMTDNQGAWVNRISTYMMGLLVYKFCVYTFFTVALVSCVELLNQWTSFGTNSEMGVMLKIYGSVVLVMSGYLLPGLWVMALANTTRQLQKKGEMLATSLMGWAPTHYWKQVWGHGGCLTIMYALLIGWYSPLALQQQQIVRHEVLSQLDLKQLTTQFNTLPLGKNRTLMFWLDDQKNSHRPSPQALSMNVYGDKLSMWKWVEEANIHHDLGKQGLHFRNGRGLVAIDQEVRYDFQFKDGFMPIDFKSEVSKPMSMFAHTAQELWLSTNQRFQKELIWRVGMVCSILLYTWLVYCLFHNIESSANTLVDYVYLVMGYLSYVIGLLFFKSTQWISSITYTYAMLAFLIVLSGSAYRLKVRSKK